ncbi:MAG: protein kinase domain-containing protein, partial [Gemmata sp.]
LEPLLEATAGANIAAAQVAAAQAAWETAAEAPEAERLALEMYLGQLPDAIRKAFKRADDPQGLTAPPGFRPDAPSALVALLPRRVPRYRSGQGLPGRADWVLVRWLGGGGFGEVWLAQHRRVANRFGAAKFGLALTAEQRSLLAREARLAAQAMQGHPHPGLVPLIDTELGGDAPWLMYEYVGGGDLSDLVLAWQKLPPEGRVRAAAERLREVSEAVAALHRSRPPVVHRDLKPSNVLRDARTFRLRVTDFGAGGTGVEGQVARSRGAVAELRGAHSLLYASPQQQQGAAPDPRDDVHALGVLAFQMFTGQLTAGVPSDYDRALRAAGVPQALVQLIGRCAASDPRQRPRDAGEMVEALAGPAAALEAAPQPGARRAEFVVELAAEPAAPTETLVCPVCKARLRVAAGRVQPVPCPRCSTTFAPAAGRGALKDKPLAPPGPEGPPGAEPEPEPPPQRAKAVRVGRPRRSFRRLYSCGCFLLATGALAGAGFFFQDEITTWVKSKQAKPIEFEAGRAFEPGADTARVYALLPTEPPLLVTNADRKDVFAGVWDPRAGKRAYALKSGPTIPTAVLDPKVTQFRFHNDRLAVFNRDPQVTDRGGIWVYTLPPVRDDPPANGGKSGPPAADREVAAAELGARKRTWDVNRDLTRAVSPPNGGKATLWSPATGSTVAELSADGTAFRAGVLTGRAVPCGAVRPVVGVGVGREHREAGHRPQDAPGRAPRVGRQRTRGDDVRPGVHAARHHDR